MTERADERYVVTRTIAATPAEIFAVLVDPTLHRHTEPGDWVREAVSGASITETGQMFAMHMYREGIGHYVAYNVVTVFEPNRAIAWLPGQLDESGSHDPGGWTWRWDLSPNLEATDVTLTYDWSATPQEVRDELGGLPPFPERYIEESLAALEHTVR